MYQNHTDTRNIDNRYGITLKQILATHAISISSLAKQLELSSRNMVHRIIAGNGKYQTIAAFHERIRRHADRLHLTPDELTELDEALAAAQYGEWGNAVRTTLAEMLIHHPEEPACICVRSTDPTRHGLSLREILTALTRDRAVELFVFGSARSSLCEAIAALLKQAGPAGTDVTVRHLLGTEDSLVELRQFLASCSLMDDPRYACYRLRPSADSHAHPGYTILICRTTHEGLHFCDHIDFLTYDNFAYTPDHPDPEGSFHAYNADCFAMMAAHADRINPITDPVEEIRNMIALNEEYDACEGNWSQILIKPDLCIVHIPTELMLRQLEGSNYLGISPDSPAIRALVSVHRRRYENFSQHSHSYLLISSLSGLRRFLETGRLSDHIPLFPSFTVEERRLVLQNLLNLTHQKGGIRLRLLRDDSAYSGAIVNIFGRKKLYVIKSTVEHYQRDMMYRSEDSEMIDIMVQMIQTEIEPRYTMDEEESRRAILVLLEEFADKTDE